MVKSASCDQALHDADLPGAEFSPAEQPIPATDGDRSHGALGGVVGQGQTRAFGSPKTPRTLSNGRKPANRYASSRRLRLSEVAIAKSCQIPRRHQSTETRMQKGVQPIS